MNNTILLPEVRQFLDRPHAHFIDGQPYLGDTSKEIVVTDPSTEQPIGQVYAGNQSIVDLAVASAKKAFTGSWANTSPYERGMLLNRLADVIDAHTEEIAQLETLCSGKSIHLSRLLDAGQTAASLRYYAGWATKISGETLTPSLPSMQGEKYTAFTRREPIGVVAGIIPWNFSTMIAFWKIGAALATGCTIVIKPSEFTPLTLLRVAELATEAGIPPGVINVVNGYGEIGQQLIAHPDIAKVSFTGSVPTGLAVGQSAIAANLTRFTLELGGKNAAALLDDVNIDMAVGGLIHTGFVHQGQVCAAPERIYVPKARLDELLTKLSGALSQLKTGSPFDESVQFGPISNKPQYQKVLHYMQKAKEESRVVYGGHALEGPGYFVEPTIVQAASHTETLMHEETFGPILSFMPYEDEEEMIHWMNDTPFGLSASLWTNNLSKTLRLIPRIQAGMVWVNMHTFLDPSVPFGGSKSSGIGREFGSAFINDYTELKSVMICY